MSQPLQPIPAELTSRFNTNSQIQSQKGARRRKKRSDQSYALQWSTGGEEGRGGEVGRGQKRDSETQRHRGEKEINTKSGSVVTSACLVYMGFYANGSEIYHLSTQWHLQS